MKLTGPRDVTADVIIIGGGGAGLRAAIAARSAGASVLIAAKSRVGYACNTSISGGRFAAVALWPDSPDSVEAHLRDTVVAGRFLNDQKLADVMARGSAQQAEDLARFGVSFVRKEGRIERFLTVGHSHPRNVRGTNSFGHDFTLPLRAHALKLGAELAEGVWVCHLLTRGERVVGAVGVNRSGEIVVFHCKAVILATGGAGEVYLNNSNAAGTTGDGYALAYNLGLSLSDMEFIQFYPTAMGRLGRRVIIYETLVRHLGATLRNSLGEDITQKHGLTDHLAMTRDRMARAVFQEIVAGRSERGGVVMDLTTIPPGVDRTRHQLPPWVPADRKRFVVAPTCHFFMGGVRTDELGRTGLEGLWAAGEVSAGVHGANRLAGNAIAEIFVFGAITGREAAAWAAKTALTEPEPESISGALDDVKSLASSAGGEGERELREDLKKSMWLNGGIIRTEQGLRQTLGRVSSLRQTLPRVKVTEPRDLLRLVELRNMLLVSEMICRAALAREESRGSHFRSDYPDENNRDWLKNVVVSRDDGEMNLRPEPVKLDRVFFSREAGATSDSPH